MAYQNLPNTFVAGSGIVQIPGPGTGPTRTGENPIIVSATAGGFPALRILPVNYIIVTGGSGSYNLSHLVSTNVLLPTGAGQTAIINFPLFPVDGQTTSFSIIGFTVSLSLGLPGAPFVQPTYAVGATAGLSYYYIYRAADFTWYRFSN